VTQGRHLVTLCGNPAVTAPDGRTVALRGAQLPAVVAVLALADGPVPRERVAEAVWGEDLSSHWPGALRGLVTRLRRSLAEIGLGADAVVSEGGALRLDVPAGALVTDVGRATADLEAAEAATTDGDHDEAARLAGRAARVLARPFLPAVDTEWSLHGRLGVEALAERSARAEVAALTAGGQPAVAARRARAHLAENPLDEPVHHLLIEALLADGRQVEALRAHAELVELLANELGIAPTGRTTALLDDVAEPAARRPRWGGGRHDGRFVGRRDELAALEAAWAEAVDESRPLLVVLEGPAGMGKTRLVRQLAARRAAEGALVAWGRSHAEDRRAFSPLSDLLDDAIDADPAVLLRAGPRAAGLVPLLPALEARLPGRARPVDDAMARSHLFTAARAVLAAFAERPALAVVDDVHWATADGLALLESCLDGLDRPLVVVATTRPLPPGQPDPLAAAAGVVATERLRLSALDVDEVTELVAGHPPPFAADERGAGEAVHGRTGGLPFLANEVRRAGGRERRLDERSSVPEVVRAWVGAQVAALPAPLVEVLETVAVVGDHVDLGLLGRSLGDRAVDLPAAVDRLVAAGLLYEEVAGVVAFVHAMSADAVYDGLGPGRRSALHGRVAAALAERLPTGGRSAELAHHYGLAGPEARGLAATHAERAGRQALAVGAWGQAEERFRDAVAAAEVVALRVRATVGLGRSLLHQARFAEARTALEDAEAQAAEHGLPQERAEAALALVGRAGRGVAPDRDLQADRLRAAIAELVAAPPGRAEDVRRRQVLLSHLERELAVSLLLTGAATERDALLVSALDRALLVEPPDGACTAAAVLAQRMGSAGARPLARRLVDTEEVLALPADRLAPDLRLLASCYRHVDLVQAGRRADADEVLAVAEALVRSYPDPYWRWATATWRGLGLVVAGDLDGAERAAFDAAALLPGVPEAEACLGVNLVDLRLYQGRAGEVLDPLHQAVARHPEIPCYRAVLALCAAEAGDLAAAEAAYRWFAEEGFASLPDDTNRLLGLAVLAHVGADLGDADGGAVLAELLAPHRGEWVVLDCYGGGGASWGPVAHALARSAVVTGRAADAEVLFAEATVEAAGAPLVLERIAAHRTG
jgi:DNA-binding SARP family transcriptional activator